MRFFQKRSFLFGTAYYIAVSLGIILFASPLFRVLGFEYSGLISLFCSIHLLYYCAWEARKAGEKNMLTIARDLAAEVFVLTSIPLLISIISVVAIPNCSLSDGIIFYLEVVYPTAAIAFLSGLFFSQACKTRFELHLFLPLFWIITLAVSLLPGYYSGRIYTYGWQYGYFPGFVWDEAMELSKTYWNSRLIQFGILFQIWFIFWDSKKSTDEEYEAMEKERKKRLTWRGILIIFLTITLEHSLDNLLDDSNIEKYLINEMHVYNLHIHYRIDNFKPDELSVLQFDAINDEEDVDSTYKLHTENDKIEIYIFPTADDLYEYVGTREASISKPWLHSIYITKSNLRSLKHELTHILLSGQGSSPFDISWSTGLTEGAAVAIEDDYDGIRNCNELSTQILQMHFANGVGNVMKPTGFLSSAAGLSYVLSGSFATYLRERYGAKPFVETYSDVDFKKHYGSEFAVLENEWKVWLKKFNAPMDHYDSLRTAFYFKRTPLVNEPCLRRIGKLTSAADELFKAKQYEQADSLYQIVVAESGRLKAIRGRVLSQLHLNKPEAALTILDTTQMALEINNLAALRVMRGDICVLAGMDPDRARHEWDEAVKLQLGDNYFLGAYTRRNFFGGAKQITGVQNILRDLYGLKEDTNKYDLVFNVEPVDTTSSNASFYSARLFLYISYLEKQGKLFEVQRAWRKKLQIPENIYTGDNHRSEDGYELYRKLVTKKIQHYQEVFSPRKKKEK
jgi:hypothetical protein